MKRTALLVAGAVAVGVAVLGVTALEATRGPQRTGVLRGEAAALHAAIMRTEESTPIGTLTDDPRLATSFERLEQSIARGDRSAAIHAWQDAYALALGSRRWEPMVAVGEAAVELGRLTNAPATAAASARDAYMVALVRARRLESSAGLVRVAAAMAALGDTATAREARRLTDTFTAGSATVAF